MKIPRLSNSELATTPMLPIAVFFALGIILYEYGIREAGIAVFILLAAVICFWSRSVSLLFITAAFGFFISWMDFGDSTETVPLICKQAQYTAKIFDITEYDYTQAIDVKLLSITNDDSENSSDPINAYARLFHPGYERDLGKGDIITFKATLSPVTALRDLPYETDPADFLAKKHIFLTGWLPDSAIVAVKPYTGINHRIEIFRNKVLGIIYTSPYLSGFSKEILGAVLAGDTKELDVDTRGKIQSAGLSHMLAVSGAHVAVISFIISFLLWPLRMFGWHKSKTMILLLLGWGFVWFCGCPPSALRAIIMVTIFSLGRLFQKKTTGINNLAAAAFIIMLFDPQSLFSLGFLLSFSAVLMIILFAEPINPVPPRYVFWHSIMSYFCITLCAVTGTSIICVISFHRLPLMFLVSNLVCCIALPIIVFAGLCFVIFSLLNLNNICFCHIINFFTDIINYTISGISSFRFSEITNVDFKAWILLPYLLTIILLKVWLDKPSRKRGAALLSSVAILICSIYVSIPREYNRKIYISRHTESTEVLFPSEDNSLEIISSKPNFPITMYERAKFRYGSYMMAHGLDSIKMDTSTVTKTKNITFGTKSMTMIYGENVDGSFPSTDYALLCKGYRGTISQVIDSLNPDTIILSYDLHPKRAQNYIAQCVLARKPYIWLRQRPWSSPFICR